MKKLVTTVALFAAFTLAVQAQSRSDSTSRQKPILSEETRQSINQKSTQATEKFEEALDQSISYQQRNQLSWFQPGNLFLGGGLGMGAANGQAYVALNTRVGYFFQPGFAAGLRFDTDRLVGNKYNSRQIGAFARYYPFRTRISSFLGASLNSGREFSDNLPPETKAKYTSVGLEVGVMAWILHRLGAELSYESNFYNKLDPTVSRGKGNRIKLGVNYYFGQVSNRGVKLTR
ncbi:MULTISPECIES: hypothetical protein [unclassified Spirosoma]|uniref:hypothetical protein n=1 Tax=unclassified Spirosoma TaxID=2621999 RepID=UPI000964B459|nr:MULTISPECIES: hypothetical protein [unclassified Spirosoma]MBN8821021.1 hypothetical protein [Spirosoma sp.]OJW76024.1 MAG: hypothetical protein BGO59_04130 [Spirosoma sp. 48-14]